MEIASQNSGSPGNAPSLYDTSISTVDVESWSTSSGGRHQHKQQSHLNPSPYYLPSVSTKTLDHKENVTYSKSPKMRLSESPRLVAHEDRPNGGDFSPRSNTSNNINAEKAYSEPGASINARYTAFLNRRFHSIGATNNRSQKSQEYAHSDIGISARINEYNQQFPDPEPVLTAPPFRHEEEQRQTASSLQPAAEERVVNRPGPTATYASPKASLNKNNYVPMAQRQTTTRFESKASPRIQPSPRSQPSPRIQSSPRIQQSPRARPSPTAQPSASRVRPSPISTSSTTAKKFLFEPAPSPTPTSISQPTIERPPVTTVQDLKRQLWTDDEKLQVAVPPSITSPKEVVVASDRRKSHDPMLCADRNSSPNNRSQRSARSLSPGKQRNNSGGDGMFKSKFYEAALAARMRGKVHSTQIDPRDVPREVQKHNREKSKKNPHEILYSISASTSFSDAMDNKSLGGSGTAGSGSVNSGHRSYHGRSSVPAPEFFETLRPSSSWADRPGHEAKELSTVNPFVRVRSFDDKSMSSSKERRANSVGRALPPDNPTTRRPSARASPRRRPPSLFMEQRQREFSPERSHLTTKKPCSPFMEHRIKGFSSPSPRRQLHSSSGPDIQYHGKAMRRGSGSSIEKLAREFSGDINQIVAPALAVSPSTKATEAQPRSVNAYWQKKGIPSSPAPLPQKVNPSNNDSRRERGRNGPKNQVLSDGQENRDVADLVAKLYAINRENPAEALAQIDSILRNESRVSASACESETQNNRITNNDPQQSNGSRCSSDPSESDDETSVSSITNPSYQVSNHQDQIRVVSQSSANNVLESPTTMGHQESTNLPPSTSSFRRPRPSTLQQYATPMHHEAPALPRSPPLSRTQEKRMHIKQYPPPTTIRVNNQMNNGASDANHECGTQHPMETPKKDSTNSRPTNPSQSQSKLDTFVSNQEEIAAKIRVWDELSAGGRNKPQVGRSESHEGSDVEAESPTHKKLTAGNRMNAQQTAARGRNHPWNEEVGKGMKEVASMEKYDPTESGMKQKEKQVQGLSTGNPNRLKMEPRSRQGNVKLKDTSMDNAFGVELQMEKSGQPLESSEENFNPAKKMPESLSSVFSPTSSTTSPPAEASNDFFVGASPFEADESNFFARDERSSTPGAITKQQQENAQKISDAFDAAWVSMPSLSFFPGDKIPVVKPEKHLDMNADWPDPASGSWGSQKESGSTNSLVDHNNSFDNNTSQTSASGVHPPPPPPQDVPTTGPLSERASIEVSLLEECYPSLSPPNKELEQEQEQDNLKFQDHHTKGPENETKKRKGLLRAFMRREKKKDGPKKASKKASGGSLGGNSVPNRPQPQIATALLPPGVHDQKEMAAPPPRGRRQNSPRRTTGRSNSLERFRSKSMAQKFSRVMRLYDD